MDGVTKYILMKRCLNCFNIVDNSLKSCTHCGHLFLAPATDEEIAESNEKLYEMKREAKDRLID